MKLGKAEAARIAASYGVTCAAGVVVTLCPPGATVTQMDGMSWKDMTVASHRARMRRNRFERAARRAVVKVAAKNNP